MIYALAVCGPVVTGFRLDPCQNGLYLPQADRLKPKMEAGRRIHVELTHTTTTPAGGDNAILTSNKCFYNLKALYNKRCFLPNMSLVQGVVVTYCSWDLLKIDESGVKT